MNTAPIRVAVTGAAGQIGYSLLFRIASGALFRPSQAVIAMKHATGKSSRRFFAMTMLDESRAKTQLAKKASVDVTGVSNLAIWGNHSATMYPDFFNAKINGRPVPDVISHREWLEKDF